MGEQTGISWADHTFNPWRGCEKVSEACRYCYAERLSQRNPNVLGEWGPNGKRVVAADSTWREPLKWDRKAQAAGERRRVFCASIADVFEDRTDLVAPRARLFDLIRETPHLDWLLLTKRPENIAEMLPEDWGEWGWPNAWLGVSVEDQEAAEERIPKLLSVPAALRFLSCEPLLGPVDLVKATGCAAWDGSCEIGLEGVPTSGLVDWVIVGGESGPKARPMHPDWARGLRDQCVSAGVPFFFKQWGEWRAFYDRADDPDWQRVPYVRGDPRRRWLNLAGGHGFHGQRVCAFERVGKKAAGRLLDWQLWDQVPQTKEA